MHYFCALNTLQYKKKIAMLEPLLGYMQAQVNSKMCGEGEILDYYIKIFWASKVLKYFGIVALSLSIQSNQAEGLDG